MHSLHDLGFFPYFSAQWELMANAEHLVPARVVFDSHGIYELAGCDASHGELSGRLRRSLDDGAGPTTGDWVLVTPGSERGIIHHVLERKTVLQRRAAGSDGAAQVLVANVDVFFIVTSATQELNPRRLERYLAAVYGGGGQPVVVLNKIDLALDAAPLQQAIEAVALAVPVVMMSAETGTGMDDLKRHLGAGRTGCFVGSSGVGKSSLVNCLLDRDSQRTCSTGSDAKGRHTTTARQLFVLAGGGVLIDTPGLRELGILDDEGGLESAFSDIAALAERCRFRDCEHGREPGCAVQHAAATGELSPHRLGGWHKLRRELAAAEARRTPAAMANSKRRWKSIHKQMRSSQRDD